MDLARNDELHGGEVCGNSPLELRADRREKDIPHPRPVAPGKQGIPDSVRFEKVVFTQSDRSHSLILGPLRLRDQLPCLGLQCRKGLGVKYWLRVASLSFKEWVHSRLKHFDYRMPNQQSLSALGP